MSAERELQAATRHIVRARKDRESMTAEMEKLYMLGVWRATPSIKWRGVSGDLMSLRFPRKKGVFQGPEGKEKVYIGNNKEAQEKARAKVERTRRFLELEAKRKELTDWLIERDREAKRLALSWSRWPK